MVSKRAPTQWAGRREHRGATGHLPPRRPPRRPGDSGAGPGRGEGCRRAVGGRGRPPRRGQLRRPLPALRGPQRAAVRGGHRGRPAAVGADGGGGREGRVSAAEGGDPVSQAVETLAALAAVYVRYTLAHGAAFELILADELQDFPVEERRDVT